MFDEFKTKANYLAVSNYNEFPNLKSQQGYSIYTFFGIKLKIEIG